MIKAKARFQRLLKLNADAVIDSPGAETDTSGVQAEMRGAEARLAEVGRSVTLVELYPQTVGRYSDVVENIAARLIALDPVADAEAIAAVRQIIAGIAIHRWEPRGAMIEVASWLSALTGQDPAKVGAYGSGGGT